MTEWRPIKTAPAAGGWLLILYDPDAGVGPGYFGWDDGLVYSAPDDEEGQIYYESRGTPEWFCFDHECMKRIFPTHWMPLPEPPK